jgi:hypothetical protein
MLHIWDQNYMSKGMLHGQSLLDGSFQFNEVPIELNSIYGVMATYDGGTYFSEPMLLESDVIPLEFEVSIYEATSDTTQIIAEQAHVLFSFDMGGLRIWEVYLLSNLGEYTVKDSLILEDGTSATYQFRLPENATNVTFESDDDSRFVQLPGGFADTAPIVPGVGSNKVVTSYILPYEEEFIYKFEAPLDVNDVRFLVVDDPGIELTGENLVAEESQTMQDGTTFRVYSRDGVKANETISVVISGESESVEPRVDLIETGSTNSRYSNLEIGIGAFILGLALVIAGGWWWLKPSKDFEDDVDFALDDPDFKTLVAEIVALDETYHSGGMSAEAYEQNREALIIRGKEMLIEEPISPDVVRQSL